MKLCEQVESKTWIRCYPQFFPKLYMSYQLDNNRFRFRYSFSISLSSVRS